MPYPQTRWSLAAILPAPAGAEVDRLVEELETTTAALEAMRPVLSPDITGQDFAKALAHLETIAQIASRLGSYGPLWFAEDTQNQDALAFMGRMDELLAEAQNRTLFFNLWWKELDEQNAARLLASADDPRYYLEKERLFKAHT
ncbi:MAG: hypothetical protein JW953_01725 [Anaerolineae bacterium]|nr:hypothetical protein [Anaerolineae bacterium]